MVVESKYGDRDEEPKVTPREAVDAMGRTVPPPEPDWSGYEGLPSGDVMEKIGVTLRWGTWAKAEITRHEEQMAARMREVNAALKVADDQRTMVKGLRAELEERRTKTVEVLGVGTEVRLTRLGGFAGVGLLGWVLEVRIDRGGPHYRVYWWVRGGRQDSWLEPSEVECVGDDLPLAAMFPGGRGDGL
jgi:hypothetical protein